MKKKPKPPKKIREHVSKPQPPPIRVVREGYPDVTTKPRKIK